MVFVLDNYDSFTYNLVQYMGGRKNLATVSISGYPPDSKS